MLKAKDTGTVTESQPVSQIIGTTMIIIVSVVVVACFFTAARTYAKKKVSPWIKAEATSDFTA